MVVRKVLSLPGTAPAAALLLTLVGGMHAPLAVADTTDLSPSPPSITTTVKPNIALSFDDSGSMSFGYMPDEMDQNGDDDGVDECKWYAYSGMNTVYYNPQITYEPPLDANGDSFVDIPFAAAPLDGFHEYLGFGAATVNLNYEYVPTDEWDRDADKDNNRFDTDCIPDDLDANDILEPGVTENNGVYTYTCGLFNNEYAHYDDYYNDIMCEVPPEYDLHCDGDIDDPCVVHPPADYSYIFAGKGYPAYYTKADGTTVDLTDSGIGVTVAGVTRTDAQERQNFANWYSYYRTRNLMTKTAISRAFGDLQLPIQLVWQTIWPYEAPNRDNNGRPWSLGLDVSDVIGPYRDVVAKDGTVIESGNAATFFDWLFRIRSSNGTPDRQATVRAGEYFTVDAETSARIGTNTDPYWNRLDGADSKELTCRKNYHLLVTDGYWNSDSGLDDPTTTVDIGVSGPVEASIHWNTAGDKKQTMANYAYNYWATDLAKGIANEVAPYLGDLSHDLWPGKDFDPENPWANKEVYYNPANDPATWQHLNQFVLTLGLDGTLANPGDYEALRRGTKQWPQPVADTKSALDDMWHAALVSRGAFFSASRPDRLVTHLRSVLDSIGSRNGSVTAGSLNSAVLTTGAYSYSANYIPSTWSGDLVAQRVLEDGSLGLKAWSAAAELAKTASTDRNISSSKLVGTTASGVEFNWTSLDAEEQAWLNTNPATGAADSNGSKRLAWLRGYREDEDTLRSRSSVLGAIINSQPVFVSYPAFGYSNYFPKLENGDLAPEVAAFKNDDPNCADTNTCATYEQFVRNHEDRTPIAYVGANDGMLHAFNVSVVGNDNDDPNDPTDNGDPTDDSVTPTADAGKELWAFVPRTVFPHLAAQSARTGYSFRPTVDGPISVRDVFFGGAWHTILVGSLRLCGRGVYALDVTCPVASGSVCPTGFGKNDFLWEFNSKSDGADADDPTTEENPANLGFTYGEPSIGRVSSGKWVVLVPGGYFPDCDATGAPTPCDDSMKAASNKFSSLFVLDAATGELIRELRTPTGVAAVTSYGLASAVLGDYNMDQVADVAFAGDLLGNMWRFDLSNSDATKWSVSQIFKPSVPGAQPITTKPRLFPDKFSDEFVVVFGTGKYLGLEDRTNNIVTQYIYGIREASSKALVAQTLYQSTVTTGGESTIVRGVTNNAVKAGDGGWYVALDVTKGERVIATPGALFNTNRVIVPTLIPGSIDPCKPLRDGAILVLDALTGGSGDGLDMIPRPGGWPGGVNVAGARVSNPPVGGSLPVATQVGGGRLYLPGIIINIGGTNDDPTFSINAGLWRRRSWNVLQ